MAEAKKRRLAPSEDETGFVERFAEVQEKSLAQNLFRYKRSVVDLASKLAEQKLRSYGTNDLLATVNRVLQATEQDVDLLHSALAAAGISAEIQTAQIHGLSADLSAQTQAASVSASPWEAIAAVADLRQSSGLQSIKQLLNHVDDAIGSSLYSKEPVWLPPQPREGATSTAAASSNPPSSPPVEGAQDDAPEAALKAVEQAVSSGLTARVQRLLGLCRALTVAIQQLPSGTARDTALAHAEAKRQAAEQAATALWSALALRTRELEEERARSLRLDEEAHRAIRTLERLRVGNPAFAAAIKEVGGQAAAEGGMVRQRSMPSMAVGSSGEVVDVSLSRQGSVGSDIAGLSGAGNGQGTPTNTAEAGGTAALDVAMDGGGSAPGTSFGLRVSSSTTSFLAAAAGAGAPAPTPIAGLTNGYMVAPSPSASFSGMQWEDSSGLKQDLERLKKEVDTLRQSLESSQSEVAALTERLSEATTAKEASSITAAAAADRAAALERELIAARAAPATETGVKGHPTYLALYMSCEEEGRRVTHLTGQVSALQGKLDAAHEATEAQKKKVQELLALAGSVTPGGSAHASALQASVTKLKAEVAQAYQERDEALAKAAKATSDADTAGAHAVTAKEALASVSDWQAQYRNVQSVLNSKSEAAAEADTEAAAAAVTADDIPGLIVEKNSYLQALTSTSDEYEKQKLKHDALLVVLAEKDGQIGKVNMEKQKAIAERVVLASELKSKDAALAELQAVKAALESFISARDAALAEARSALEDAKESARGAQREAQGMRERAGEGVTAKLAADAKAQIDAVKEQTLKFQAEAVASLARVETLTGELASMREELAGVRAKLVKREDKIAALQASLEHQKSQTAGAEANVRTLQRASSAPVSSSISAAASADQAMLQQLKSVMFCNLCRLNQRDNCLTKCGHVFCGACIDKRVKDRARKCPSCGVGFAESEIKKLHFTH